MFVFPFCARSGVQVRRTSTYSPPLSTVFLTYSATLCLCSRLFPLSDRGPRGLHVRIGCAQQSTLRTHSNLRLRLPSALLTTTVDRALAFNPMQYRCVDWRFDQTAVVAIGVADDLLSGRHDDGSRGRHHGTRLIAEEGDMSTVRLFNDIRRCRPSAESRAVAVGLARGFH